MLRQIDQDRLTLQDTVTSLEQANERLKETRQEMVRAEKLASVGRLAAGLAHEIGNPLGVVLGYLELLRSDPLPANEKEIFIRRSTEELGRINLLVRQLLDFSRAGGKQEEEIHVHVLVPELLHFFSAQKETGMMRFRQQLDAERDRVLGNTEGLRQVLMNCLLNSVDSIQEGKIEQGEVRIATENRLRDTGEFLLCIQVRDNGIGIPEEQHENIFDPFFTTKEPGRGTGLGLSVAHTIIENMGGAISAANNPDAGITVSIELPVSTKTAPAGDTFEL